MAKIDKSPIEFFVFGDGPYLPSSGRYTTLTLNKLILEYKPHLLFFPSVINKSYSYTFSIALASKIPILSTHKGIFIEKSELSSDAYTYEILDNIDASKWYEKLMELYEYFVETDKIITFNEIDYRISPNKINEIYSNEISREI